MADELDTETLVSRALSRLREAQSLLESRSGESISQSAVAVLDAAGDLTTAWGKHLAGLPAPKAEEERKALLAAGGSAGGDDLTTLVSQLLGAPDTQASTVTSVQVTDYVAIGASPAQSGAVRLANDTAVSARNGTNSADIRMLRSTAGNGIVLIDKININAGGDTFPVSDNAQTLGWQGGRWQGGYFGQVEIGTNPAQSGAVRLANNQAITARTAANDADCEIATLDANNNVVISGSGRTVILNGSVLPIGVLNLSISPYTVLSETAAAPGVAAANQAHVWLEDNGSGKSRLMVQFATGAAVQIAIQP
jgi:hypothetical protein